MFLEHNVGHMKWAGPDLALKETRNCRRLWAGMRSECSLKEVPFAAVLGRYGMFSLSTWVLELLGPGDIWGVEDRVKTELAGVPQGAWPCYLSVLCLC